MEKGGEGPTRVISAPENREVLRVAAGLGGVSVVIDDVPTEIERFDLRKFRKVCDPFRSPCWLDRPITQREVRAALRAGNLVAESYSGSPSWNWPMDRHVARIAYLVVHPDPTPIEVDVGVPSLGCPVEWPVFDGNHRLAAAIFRGDPYILVSASGACDLIESYRWCREPMSGGRGRRKQRK